MPDQPDASRSAPAEPHHVGTDRSLVDKDQPGWIKHALLSNPTSACAGHVCSLSFFGLQAFFEGDAVSAKKPRNRTLAGLDPSLEQFRNCLHQSQVWPFGDQSQYSLRMRFQGRDTSSTGLRCGAPDLIPALHKPACRTRTDLKTIGRLAPRQPIQSHG